MSTVETLDDAIERANDMVLTFSFAVITPNAPEAQAKQGRYFLGLFSAVRNLLQDARDNYWEPGEAPDDWETSDSSRLVLALADAVLSDGAKR